MSVLAPRGGTRPTPGVSIRCRPGVLTGRQNTANNPMHRNGHAGTEFPGDRISLLPFDGWGDCSPCRHHRPLAQDRDQRPGCSIKLRGVSHPGSGKTAPGKGTKNLASVLKAFCRGNSVLLKKRETSRNITQPYHAWLCALCASTGSIRHGDSHRTGFTTETRRTQRRRGAIERLIAGKLLRA